MPERRPASAGSFEFVSLADEPAEPTSSEEEGTSDEQTASTAKPEPAEDAKAAAAAGAPALPPQASPAPSSNARKPSAPTVPDAPLLGLFGGLFAGGAAASGGGGGSRGSGAKQAAPATITGSAEDAVKEFEEALDELGKKTAEAAQEAKESLSHLAHGISSWFSSSLAKDGSSSGAVGGAMKAAAPAAVDPTMLQAQLGLEAGEAVLESFQCQLLQTYTCTSNFFTPVQTVPFAGHLHITSQRVCFEFEGEAGVAPIKVAVSSITGVSKEAAAGSLPERVVVALSQAKQTLTLAHFSLKDLEMDSALALLEHIASQS